MSNMTLSVLFLTLAVAILIIQFYRLEKTVDTLKKSTVEYANSSTDAIVTIANNVEIIQDYFRVCANEMTEEEYQKKWGIENGEQNKPNIP